ncbi:hypothetical protein Tco_0745430 [Tanacetum coccineum]
MTTLADKSLLSPPMLEKHLYDSWKSIMELYMMNRPHGRMILASVEKGPLVWPTITVDGVTRPKEYTELTPAETIQADCDIKAINIILQGLPTEIYALVSQHRVAKDIWEKIRLSAGRSNKERTRVVNCNCLEQFQVNPVSEQLHAEWSKFVTDVKWVNDFALLLMVDLIHSHLEQHDRHLANEVRLMHDVAPIHLVCLHSHQMKLSPYISQSASLLNKNSSNINNLSHLIQFSIALSLDQRDNQLRSSANPKQQATLIYWKITVKLVRWRQISMLRGHYKNFHPSEPSWGVNSGKQRIVTCYNCKGGMDTCPNNALNQEGNGMTHGLKKKCCWFKLKQVDKFYITEELDFADLGHSKKLQANIDGVITPHVAYQADDLDVYDSDCDDYSNSASCFMVMPSSEQSNVMNHSETEITSDSNIIPYSQYVIESQQAAIQNSNSLYKQDCIIVFVIEQLKNQVANIILWNYPGTHSFLEDTTKVEVPKELPKVSMVNTSLKKLKYHLVGFDVVVIRKYPPTTQTITGLVGLWNNMFRVQSPKHFDVKMTSSFGTKLIDLETTQSQEKDTVIKKLKERIKVLSGIKNEDKIKQELEEIETINIELDHRVTKLIAENEHLKQTYKQLYVSIKPTHIRSKEHCDDLINQVNLKSVKISDLNASLQEKVLVITALKDDLRKLKGKPIVDNDVTKHPSDPEMLKIDVEPITPKLLNKQTAHSAYIKHTQEETTILRDLVEHVKSKYKLDQSLESTYRYAKLVQELLTNISNTPGIKNADGKLVAMTPKNKDKSVRFTKPVTSSGNTITKTTSTSNLVSNKPMLSSTGVKPSTSASGSQPSGNTKKDKIRQTPSSTQKNKVEDHPRKVKSSLKNKDCVVKSKGTAHVQHSRLNANFELKCVKCNGCMLYANHDLRVLDFINNVNARNKSKSVKKNSKKKVWKPTGKVFTKIGYIWRPTGRTFTIVGNACPLTRITTTTEVPLRKPTALENETPKPVVTLVYSRKPRKSKTNVFDSKSKVLKSVSANKKEPSQSQGSRVSNVPSSSLNECRSSKLFSGIWTPAALSI